MPDAKEVFGEIEKRIAQKPEKVAELAAIWAKADAEGQKRFAPYLVLYLKGNPLSDAAKTNQIATLKSFNVRVDY